MATTTSKEVGFFRKVWALFPWKCSCTKSGRKAHSSHCETLSGTKCHLYEKLQGQNLSKINFFVDSDNPQNETIEPVKLEAGPIDCPKGSESMGQKASVAAADTDNFLLPSQMEEKGHVGFFSSLLIRAEQAAIGFVIGKHSIRQLAKISLGKSGVDLVDLTYELIHALMNDSKEANKFINGLLKMISEIGVLVANGKINLEEITHVQEELIKICQGFVEYDVEEQQVDALSLNAKRILFTDSVKLEELAITLLTTSGQQQVKSIKRIRQIRQILCRQTHIIDLLYDPESTAFRVATELMEKCEEVGLLAEDILTDRFLQNTENPPTKRLSKL